MFAEKILAASRRHGVTIPWFIMTSEINHEATLAAFREANYFGLPESSVMLFRQGLMPAVDREGRILLAGKGRIALSPDGHGGGPYELLSGVERWPEWRNWGSMF